ncbi:MAG TPA: hypothetical protein VJC07_04890 [Candidatus Nanoarchaeia archaeon]|nr:hypothetical protein [Candidatus Nanoarchaeia archaeon]
MMKAKSIAWSEIPVGKPKISKKKVSFTTSGGIRFSAGIVREYDLSKKLRVKAFLRHDSESTSIGFMFLETGEPNSLKVGHNAKNNTCSFSGISIFREAGFDYKNAGVRVFEPNVEKYNGQTLFVVEIKSEVKQL